VHPAGSGAHPVSCAVGKCGQGVLLTTHPLLVPWVKKERNYTSSPPVCRNWHVTCNLYLFFFACFKIKVSSSGPHYSLQCLFDVTILLFSFSSVHIHCQKYYTDQQGQCNLLCCGCCNKPYHILPFNIQVWNECLL
jgi:hypothetical protein